MLRHPLNLAGKQRSPQAATDPPTTSHVPKKRAKRSLPKRILARLLRRIKRTLDQISASYDLPPEQRELPRGSNQAQPSMSLPNRRQSFTSFRYNSNSSAPFRRRLSAFGTRTRRRLSTILESSSSSLSRRRRRSPVDWNLVDQRALEPAVLNVNTLAMRRISREGAELLRRENGWIRRWDPFDDSAWVEREHVDDGDEWETDDENEDKVEDDKSLHVHYADEVATQTLHLLDGRLASNDRPAFPSLQPNHLASALHHHSTHSKTISCSSNSTCSSQATLLTPPIRTHPLSSDQPVARGVPPSHYPASNSPNHTRVSPLIVISDWDEEMRGGQMTRTQTSLAAIKEPLTHRSWPMNVNALHLTLEETQ